MKYYLLPWIFGFLFSLGFQQSRAQVDVQISPLFLLPFEGFVLPISAEIGLARDFGLDFDLLYADGLIRNSLCFKYYLLPKRGNDRVYIGSFVNNYAEAGLGGGFQMGWKLVSSRSLIFEIGAGFGRALDGGGTGSGKLHIGYRFN